MYKLALGTMFACFAMVTSVNAEDVKKNAKSIDGAWTVVCYEKGGEAQADAKGMTVKADAGIITCAGKDGKGAMTMKVVFGPNGMIQITEVNADTTVPASAAKSGVYVLTEHYLAISLNGDAPAAGGKPTSASTKPYCNIILKREGAK